MNKLWNLNYIHKKTSADEEYIKENALMLSDNQKFINNWASAAFDEYLKSFDGFLNEKSADFSRIIKNSKDNTIWVQQIKFFANILRLMKYDNQKEIYFDLAFFNQTFKISKSTTQIKAWKKSLNELKTQKLIWI